MTKVKKQNHTITMFITLFSHPLFSKEEQQLTLSHLQKTNQTHFSSFITSIHHIHTEQVQEATTRSHETSGTHFRQQQQSYYHINNHNNIIVIIITTTTTTTATSHCSIILLLIIIHGHFTPSKSSTTTSTKSSGKNERVTKIETILAQSQQ